MQLEVSFEKNVKKNNNVEKEIDAKKPPKIATYSNLCKSLLILMPKPARTAPSLNSGIFFSSSNWLKIMLDVVDDLYFHNYQ